MWRIWRIGCLRRSMTDGAVACYLPQRRVRAG